MAGILSQGITLGLKVSPAVTYTVLDNLQEIPEMGGTANKIEVTTLADTSKRVINGITDYGDALDFKFLYDNSSATANYRVLKAAEDEGECGWEVTFPDGTTFQFVGEVSVKIDGVGVDAPLTFMASVAINSEITVTDPA